MAIDQDRITSDITLELDEAEITATEFNSAFTGFSGLVREVAKATDVKADGSSWIVNVYEGSAGLGLSAHPETIAAEAVNKVSVLVTEGLKALADGIRPPQFSDKAIEHSRTIANLFQRKKTPANVRVWAKQSIAVVITKAIATNASDILDAAYEDDGSVDGFLEKANAHNKLDFVIFDAVDKRSITCSVSETHFEHAWKAFRKRVEVIGRVKYRKDGLPVSVKATAIIPFPEPEEIPSVAEMRKLLFGG